MGGIYRGVIGSPKMGKNVGKNGPINGRLFGFTFGSMIERLKE